MIPVPLQAEPADFDTNVRRRGQKWLAKKGIAPNAAPPKASDLPRYWRDSNEQLWHAYSGMCAYLAIYFEWATGASSTDHFVAKSKHAADAYEWNNYRLSCLGANRNKRDFDDVLDPISLAADTFLLDLLSGEMLPNPALEAALATSARKTIDRLDLNSVKMTSMRARHYTKYTRKDWSSDALKDGSPFVWYEAQRQGLLCV